MDINLALKQLELHNNNYRLSTNAHDGDGTATIVFWDSSNTDSSGATVSTPPSPSALATAFTQYKAQKEPNYDTEVFNPRYVVLTETFHQLTNTVLDPANGTIQSILIGSQITFTEKLEDGQSLFLRVSTDGSNEYEVTFPTGTKFLGGSSPAISKDDETLLEIFKVNSTLYVANVGDFKTP
tara:strand:- start:25 stop:570 length:546 start_codon:yes stop_codon:yes gene_type:complete